jgi:hypothetical protein
MPKEKEADYWISLLDQWIWANAIVHCIFNKDWEKNSCRIHNNDTNESGNDNNDSKEFVFVG